MVCTVLLLVGMFRRPVLAVFLVEVHFYEESAEQSDTDTEGDNEPEIDVTEIKSDAFDSPVDECAETYTEQNTCSAEVFQIYSTKLTRLFLLLRLVNQ